MASEWTGRLRARRPGARLGVGKASPSVAMEAAGRRVGYLFPGDSGGFVLVAADDVLSPVLAYSEGTDFDPTVPVAALILKCMAARLEGLELEGALADGMWETLGEDGEEGGEEPLGAYGQFGPLLDSTWSQGNPYNRDCPIDPNTMQRSVVGCVATAMAQLMRFHGCPVTGKGEHFYERWGDVISADFEVDYDWANMPTYVSIFSPDEKIEAVAELSYHCGVAVDMMYSSSGSGAYLSDAAQAFWRYFSYMPYFTMKYRSSYSSAEWFGMMQVEISDERPVIYGIRDELGRGHAIVLDGTDDDGMFVHLNLGWGGMSDGWYSIDNFAFPSPPSTWNLSHYATVGVEPDDYAEEKFSKADLSGRWEFTTRGGYGYIVTNGEGSVEDGEFTDGTGTYAVTWGYYTVTLGGDVDITVQTSSPGYPQFDWLGAIAKSRDVAVCCDDAPSGVTGFDMCVLVRSKGTFSDADLGGTWAYGGLTCYGEVVTNGSGNVTGGWYESASVSASITGGSYGVGSDGSFSLTANIDSVVEPELSLDGYMTRGKDMAAGADVTFSLGHSKLTVLTKAHSPASAADFDNRWTFGGMRWLGEMHPDGSGGITEGGYEWINDSNYSITGGSYSVNADGTMSGTISTSNPSESSVAFEGVMNEGGEMAVCWNPSVDPSDGTRLFILLSMHNRAPEFWSATLLPATAYETSTLSVTKAGWDDDDGDAEGYIYRWKKDGVNISGGTSATLDGTYFDKGDSVSCVVRAWDGVSAGERIETALVVILNSTPSFTSAWIEPDPSTATDTLSAMCGGWSDPDPDTEDYHYQWKKNGADIVGQTSSTLDSAHFVEGDEITCVVTAWDGSEEGNSIETDPVVIYAAAGWTVVPADPEIAVGEYLNFQKSTGGDGLWSLLSAPSGGTIEAATGVYKAGATGGVTDEVACSEGAELATTTVTVTTSPRPPGTVGPPTSMDVDGSGLGISDVVLILRYVVGLDTLTPEQQTAADFDWSGTITMSDVISAMRATVGLKPEV